ncbi:MAG TPA: YfcE family phosphodiesterase [Gemmatales bacterium]|nr:YfcE family phosphodiesterase [Gemmatales bacterium]HMP58815.1 YfcE family phosphodiesterase [Gemmatales bacterium]
MLIGLLSDTHDHQARTERAVQLLVDAGAEIFIHCGDLTGPRIVHACSVRPCYFVFGNNDVWGPGDQASADTLRNAALEAGATCLDWGGIVTLDGKSLAVTHGHLASEERHLLAHRPDYLLSGHTHVRHDHRASGVRLINPGALHRASEHTVALLDLATDELRFLRVPKPPP